jgi:hypothetical protein
MKKTTPMLSEHEVLTWVQESVTGLDKMRWVHEKQLKNVKTRPPSDTPRLRRVRSWRRRYIRKLEDSKRDFSKALGWLKLLEPSSAAPLDPATAMGLQNMHAEAQRQLDLLTPKDQPAPSHRPPIPEDTYIIAALGVKVLVRSVGLSESAAAEKVAARLGPVVRPRSILRWMRAPHGRAVLAVLLWESAAAAATAPSARAMGR